MGKADEPRPPGPDSGEGDWDADVREALARAEELEQLQHPVPKHTSRGKILGLLLVPLVAVVAWNVWDIKRPPRPMEPEAQQASLSGLVYVLAQQLEAYHVRNGAYPASLDAVAPALTGVSYRLEGDGYVLEADAHDEAVVYGSWEDAGRLLVRSARSEGGTP